MSPSQHLSISSLGAEGEEKGSCQQLIVTDSSLVFYAALEQPVSKMTMTNQSKYILLEIQTPQIVSGYVAIKWAVLSVTFIWKHSFLLELAALRREMYFPKAICFHNCCHVKLSVIDCYHWGTVRLYTKVKMLHFSTCTKKYGKWPCKGTGRLSQARTSPKAKAWLCPGLSAVLNIKVSGVMQT